VEYVTGVAEIAQDMGYPVNHSNRGKLGKFVKSQLGDVGQRQESRLCNGTDRPIWCYPDTPEVRGAIAQFFK
jgi:hypothetical protein